MIFSLTCMNLNLQIFPAHDLNLLFSLMFLALYVKYQHCTIFQQSFIKWTLKNYISLFLSDRLLHNMKDQGQMIYEERLLNQSNGCPQF